MDNKISKKIKDIFNSKALKYGSRSLFLTLVVIFSVILLNLIFGRLQNKGVIPTEWDLTTTKIYSLGDITKKLLVSLNKDVEIYCLFDENQRRSDLEEIVQLLRQYNKYKNIKIEYIDPDKNPGIIKSLDPDNLNNLSKSDIVVKSGSKIKAIPQSELFTEYFSQQTMRYYKTGSNAEQAISGAIKFVISKRTPTAYFTTSHGERDVDKELTLLKQYLERNNLQVKTISLITEGKIPEDAEMLIITSPKYDIIEEEKNTLDDFLSKGGNLILLIDSLESNQNFTNFEKLLNNYNISIDYDKVKENNPQNHAPQNPFEIIPDVQNNEITQALDPDKFYMVLPNSRSFKILMNLKEYLIIIPLLKSSKSADGIQIADPDGKTIVGPLDLSIAVQSKDESNPTKLFVVGNGEFITDEAVNRYEQYSQNGMIFFLNTLTWMRDEDTSLVIAPKPYDVRRLTINAFQSIIVAIIIVLVIPALILLFGIIIWLRRRHL